MTMTDPIADLLTRIRNAARARQTSCDIPASIEKESILKIFKKQGFIKDFVRKEAEPQDTLVVFLKYLGRTQKSVIHKIERVSRPGRRIYCGYRDLQPLLGGMGATVVSTPQGILSDNDVRQNKLGGEVLCRIW